MLFWLFHPSSNFSVVPLGWSFDMENALTNTRNGATVVAPLSWEIGIP